MRAANGLLVVVVALVAVPLLAVYSAWFSVDTELWAHLLATRLPQLLVNTFILLLLVGTGVLIVGVGLAWLVSMYEFPGRRWLEWALMLPMALPAYVMAFVFLGLFEYSGPLQSWLRDHDLHALTVADVRNVGSISLVMIAVLYPYVYLLARNAFLAQGMHFIEAAQSLGANKWRVAMTVNLGMARPAITAGVALALMETLADFGTVAIFNYDTFTVAIYKAWFHYFDLQLACQLASILLLLVAVALMAENNARGKRAYSDKQDIHPRKQLSGFKAWLSTGYAGLMVLLCFVLPLLQLLHWALSDLVVIHDAHFQRLVWRTLTLAAAAALLTAAVATGLGLLQRFTSQRWKLQLINFAKLGYALPGTVLAVGIVLPLGLFERLIAPLRDLWGLPPGQLLLGSVAALLIAYMVRFLAVAMGPIESGLSRLKKSIPEAAITLGAGRLRLFLTVYFPLVRAGLLLAMLMVFVDVVKEMPATLLMRPFGWDTLAVRIYEMTSEGEYRRAALPAICILLVSIIPIIVTIRHTGLKQAAKNTG
jgi:iron(III) transport system permease protein